MIKNLLLKTIDYLTKKTDKDRVKKLEPRHIQIAKKYHGMHEKRDNKELTKLLGFDPAQTPWCAGFINSVEQKVNRAGVGNLAARSYLRYGNGVDRPVFGDIVVFRRGNSTWQGHVGYYISERKNDILVLGGNQSNKVCYKYYSKSDVLGYRRPRLTV